MARLTKQLPATLDARGRTHGSFTTNAEVCIATRDLWRSAPGWSELTPAHQLVLDEIALKVARILSGGAALDEHFHDMEGYSHLGGLACKR
jgi:hypothetical protein